MPKQKPGRSKQDYQTPPEFLSAVKNRLCIAEFDIDLAATRANAVCSYYYSLEEGRDSLGENSWQVPEPESGWAWLNPPYTNIAPWVEKAAREAQQGAQVAVLVPSSVGANWWRDWVEAYAYQSHLNGRITFVGAEDPYPKDCSLLLYTPWQFMGHEIWHWESSVPKLHQSGPCEDQGLHPVPSVSLEGRL
jgi:phage N-6-adenine-methyltransferase